MSCACKRTQTLEYVWTSEDGETSVTYTTLMAAKAKVLRKGGSYKPQEVKP